MRLRTPRRPPRSLFNFFIVNYFIASGAFVLYLVKDDGSNFVSDSVVFLRYVFALLPPVLFYKCLFDISQFAIRRQGIQTVELARTYTSVFPITTCWAYVLLGGGRGGGGGGGRVDERVSCLFVWPPSRAWLSPLGCALRD